VKWLTVDWNTGKTGESVCLSVSVVVSGYCICAGVNWVFMLWWHWSACDVCNCVVVWFVWLYVLW